MSNPMLRTTMFTTGTVSVTATTSKSNPAADAAEREHAMMSVSGVVTATATLFALFSAAAVWGWSQVRATPLTGGYTMPNWLTFAIVGGFVVAFVARFMPKAAVVLGPAYAVIQGAVVGAVSRYYHVAFDGIVLQAVGATAGVFVAVLVLYTTGLVRVTRTFRFAVVSFSFGLALYYSASLIAGAFGLEAPLVNSASSAGVAFTLLAAFLAAANLALDFDTVSRGVAARAPKHMEWYAALGLVVTVVWLYLELLRLFAKIRR